VDTSWSLLQIPPSLNSEIMTLHCNYHAKPGTIVLAFHTSLRLSLRESLAGGLPPDQKNHIGCGVPVGYVPRVWLHVRSSAGMPYPSLHQTWWVTGQALCSFHPGPCHCIEREGCKKDKCTLTTTSSRDIIPHRNDIQHLDNQGRQTILVVRSIANR
jgi:hypothetical protein